jgi:MFS family permease
MLSTCQDCATTTAVASSELEACESCQTCRSDYGSSFYNLKDGCCLSLTEYGILASLGFAVVFSILGLFAGLASDRAFQRNKGVILHAVAIFVWSLSTYGEGLCSDFWGLLMCRVLLGIGEAFNAPCSYAIIALFFDSTERASANALYTFGAVLRRNSNEE